MSTQIELILERVKRQKAIFEAALNEIAVVPLHRPSSGHLYECAWCNGSADIARRALEAAKEQ